MALDLMEYGVRPSLGGLVAITTPSYEVIVPLEQRALEVEFFQWKRFYMRKLKFTDS
jgi:hypothetical protein